MKIWYHILDINYSIIWCMHEYSFNANGINASYTAIDIDSAHISDVTSYIRSDDFLGANVTMPLKTDIIEYIDELDITSRLSGAVNTIVPVNGQLIGYTTDGAGFVDALSQIGVSITVKNILILGAGGAAKSIIVKCALDGAKSITIAKRYNNSLSSVEEFGQNVSSETNCDVRIIDIEDSSVMRDTINKSDVLINATPIGMDGDTSLIEKSMLNPSLVVCDLIYEPAMTKLLNDAAECGCTYMNGKYMLLYQGARSFKLWTDSDMPINDVKRKYFDIN